MKPTNTTGGFRRIIERSEQKARTMYNQKLTEREDHILKLKEKFENTKGLALNKGRLDEMFEKDARKASNLVLFLEGSEKEAYNNPLLLQNANQKMIIESMAKNNGRITEAMQTGGAMALMLPSDIVKISRIGYSNSVAQDIFDVWGMSSMKDSLYKLETIYGSTARGATAGDVTIESYNDGRYPTTQEKEVLTTSDAGTTWGTTLSNFPLIPFKVNVIVDDAQVGVDNGSGAIMGDGVTGTVNYTTGVVSLTFSPALSATADVEVLYTYDFEDESLFSDTGSVLLNLVAYDFSAVLLPLAIEWTRFTEDLMQSKLGLSAKDMLIAGAGDEFRKAFDERCIKRGINASGWTVGETFDTDFASAGADSSDAHAQAVISAIVNTENLTYDRLGRLADTTNIVCDSKAYAYLSKHRQFVSVTPTSKVGIFKVGELAGRGIYMAPKSLINPANGTGMCYLFGKSTQGQNVDAPISVGTYGTGITTNPVELKNFNSQMGMGVYADLKLNNKYFATKLTLTNLSSNS